MQLCTGGGVCVCGEIGVPEETLFAAAEGFRTRHGRHGGNLRSGLRAVMLAGFKNSCADPKNPKTKAATYQLTREITRQFAEKNHALVCKELKGVETGVVLRSCRTVSAMRLRSRKRYYNELRRVHLRSSCGTSGTQKAEHNDDIIIGIKSKQSRCPCVEELSFTQGHFIYCTETEPVKNSHLQNMHKKKNEKP